MATHAMLPTNKTHQSGAPGAPGHRCAACGGPLVGMVYMVSGSHARYCQTCFATRPRCDSCGAPLAPDHWRLHDGRLHCATCHQTAIYDLELAQQLYQETIAGVVASLGLRLNVGVAFRMIDAPTLHDLRAEFDLPVPSPMPPATLRTLGLYQRRGHMRVIYVLYGLPRLTFRTTVAHEYAHGWQGEHCPLLQDHALIEGFAEWVSFYYLLWLGATRAARLMLETNHPYRDMMERMFELERQLGKPGLIEYMKRAE